MSKIPNYTSILKSGNKHKDLEVNHVLVELNSYSKLAAQEQHTLLQKALQLCNDTQSYSLAIAVLRLTNTNKSSNSNKLTDNNKDTNTRADTLSVVLNITDESNPLFADLIRELSEGERLLVLGSLIEESRLEPDNNFRLLKLKRLISFIPKGSRSLYWQEAKALSMNGDDDAQLALLGFVRQLPETAQSITYNTLKESIQKVRHPFKRAMAFASLSEFISLSREDFQDAEKSAEQIPNDILRVITTTRLSKLKLKGAR